MNRRYHNMEQEPFEDACLRLDFGTRQTRIASRPNLICRNRGPSLNAIMDVVGEPCGIWNGFPPGLGPTDPEDWEGEFPLIESFRRIWREPASQEWLRRRDGFGDDGRTE